MLIRHHHPKRFRHFLLHFQQKGKCLIRFLSSPKVIFHVRCPRYNFIFNTLSFKTLSLKLFFKTFFFKTFKVSILFRVFILRNLIFHHSFHLPTLFHRPTLSPNRPAASPSPSSFYQSPSYFSIAQLYLSVPTLSPNFIFQTFSFQTFFFPFQLWSFPPATSPNSQDPGVVSSADY